MTESLTGNLWEHISIFVSGATALGIVAHAVNTFPTPASRYGAWLLGVVQFAVGQRVAALNTLSGKQSRIVAEGGPAAKPGD